MLVLNWMRPPAPAVGPAENSYTLTDHRRATSPKLTLLVALCSCVDGKVFRENRCQHQVVRVVPGLVPSTLGPHHPPRSDRPHVVSRHLPRHLATNLHDLVQSMQLQSPNPKAPLNGNTDRLCRRSLLGLTVRSQGAVPTCRKILHRTCTYARNLAETPPWLSNSCISARCVEESRKRPTLRTHRGRAGPGGLLISTDLATHPLLSTNSGKYGGIRLAKYTSRKRSMS